MTHGNELHTTIPTTNQGDESLDHRVEVNTMLFEWRLTSSDVQPLPEIYPRITSPLILRQMAVSAAAKRISHFMRVNSVRCRYETDRARAIGSTSHVTFVVQLWKPRHSVDNDTRQSSVWVEITRRKGCCLALHKIRSSLAQTLQSNDSPLVRYERLLTVKPIPSQYSVISKPLERRSKNYGEFCQTHYVLSCIDMLESESYDEQDLGMENLVFLTDSAKVSKDQAKEAAMALIFRTNETSNVGDRLQNAVEDYAYNLEEARPRVPDESPFHNTLTAISNSIELLLELPHADYRFDGNNDSSRMLCVYWRHIVQFSLRRLHDFRKFPESAALAAKCIRMLETLAVCYGGCIDEIYSQYKILPPLLAEAHQYGRNFNAMLEYEASFLCRIVEKP